MRNSPGRVRIIGGRWRGRRVRVTDAQGLRPTPDRVRETLFNWLAPSLPGARVLDLFAGSGVLGFEALSRGASSAVLVDDNPQVTTGLRDTARELRAGNVDILTADAMAFLESTHRGPFDVVFVDPPYAFADYESLCETLERRATLRPGALVYVESSAHRAWGLQPPGSWEHRRTGRAGAVEFALWSRGGGDSEDNGPAGRPPAD